MMQVLVGTRIGHRCALVGTHLASNVAALGTSWQPHWSSLGTHRHTLEKLDAFDYQVVVHNR